MRIEPDWTIMKLIHELIHDLKPSTLFPAICIGFILGLLLIILEISFAAMIFSGEINHLAVRGVGLTLTGAFVACLITALFGSFKSDINLPQDAPAAIFSGSAAFIAAGMGVHSDGLFITLVAALMLGTFATAVFLFVVARFSLIHFFRYIPYPVIGGFLAGTGWILTSGSIEVMMGSSLSISSIGDALAYQSLILWLPGAVLAVVLFSVLRKWSGFLILPSALALSVFVFHVVLHLSDISLEQARERGFLFGSLDEGGLWPVFAWSDFSMVDWSLVISQLPVILTIPFITLIGLMLNMGGVELASRKSINMNRTIMANSFSNFFAGFVGSPSCYSSLSLSMLGLKTGAYTRLVGIVAALMVAMTLIWGGLLISVFPKVVLGGFLMLLGFFFLWDWAVETRKKMGWPDYCIVLAILFTIAWQGFFQGVILGILLAVILFVVRFSQVSIISRQTTGAEFQSKKARPLPHKRILLEQGNRIIVFELSGYLFFGSVNSLVKKIHEEVGKGVFSGDQYVVVDFSGTKGVDVSAVNSFVRLINKFSEDGVFIIVTAVQPLFLYQLKQHLGQMQPDSVLFSFQSLDQGLEWVEDRLLAEQARQFENGEHREQQGRLFDQVADQMLKKLEELEHAEAVLSMIRDYSEEIALNKGDVLIKPDVPVNGFFWIQQGRVVEYAEDNKNALAEYGAGDVINPGGVFEETTLHSLHKADSGCLALFFSGENIRELEVQQPEMAAKLYSMLLKRLLKSISPL